MISLWRRINIPKCFTKNSYCTLEGGNLKEKTSKVPDKLYKTIELEIKSSETAVMKSYTHFITSAAKLLGITLAKSWSSKKPSFKRLTLLKSIHIYKKHMVQYEVRTYFHWLQFSNLTGSTADTFLEYIERMLPEGVGMKVTRISLETIPSHLQPEEVQLTPGNVPSDESK